MAPGHDKISTEIIKLFDEITLNLFIHIINNIIYTCEKPNILKLTIINPINKKEMKIMSTIIDQ